jgi:YkoY family integral membrane protein
MLDRIFDFAPSPGTDALLLLPVLIALEMVLSADNAIALAALARGLERLDLEHKALNFGLAVALVLRILLILSATWVIRFWQFELAGACYLLWLVWQYFSSSEDEEHHHHGLRFKSLWQAIPVIAFTDLAFSLDSVTTAIALSENLWIILTGGVIGVIALRFMAEFFIRWLEEYEYLETAGYLTVALIGLRLLGKVVLPDLVLLIPDWFMLILVALFFAWGFSKRKAPIDDLEFHKKP